VFNVVVLGSSLLRRRWRLFIVMVVLSVVATIGLGAFWLWSDRQAMPTIEHYTWTGWHALIFPGIYTAGVLAILDWTVRGTVRFVTKRWRRRLVNATNPL
jgi:hypothetical protein